MSISLGIKLISYGHIESFPRKMSFLGKYMHGAPSKFNCILSLLSLSYYGLLSLTAVSYPLIRHLSLAGKCRGRLARWNGSATAGRAASHGGSAPTARGRWSSNVWGL